MQDLNLVCTELLSQSKLVFSLDSVTSSIRLAFTTNDNQTNVTFLCHEYVQLDVAKRKDRDNDFLVNEVIVDIMTEQHIVETLFAHHGWNDVVDADVEPLYNIQVKGEIAIDIVCARLAWKQNEEEFIVPKLAHQVM